MEPFLRVLVLQQGREVECSPGAAIRRLGDAYFVVNARGAEVVGPYPNLPALFQAHGTLLVQAAGGRILEWEGWVLSQDDQGRVAGPYPGFDEWVWMEGELLPPIPFESDGSPAQGGRVHHWRGRYFISVDPLPAFHAPFESAESAESAARELTILSTRGGSRVHDA